MLTRDRLNFRYVTLDYDSERTNQKTYVGDARNLNLIENDSIDLIATHPPYANIIPYSKEKIEGDLSNVYSIDEFVGEMKQVAEESFRVLKPNRYCAILIGDTRRHKHHVPIAFRVLEKFLEAEFILKEDVIKHQWRCKSTPFWLMKSIKSNFLLLMYEHLFIFRKPMKDERLNKYKESMDWS
jgi:DNA modification methylase